MLDPPMLFLMFYNYVCVYIYKYKIICMHICVYISICIYIYRYIEIYRGFEMKNAEREN